VASIVLALLAASLGAALGGRWFGLSAGGTALLLTLAIKFVQRTDAASHRQSSIE
jgi:hypothetical protein